MAYDHLVENLKRTARDDDVRIFRQWENGEISIDEVISLFRKHNNIRSLLYISNNDMIEFMNSLGYRRY